MTDAREPVLYGESVVVVDTAGQLVRDRNGRIMRGVVMRLSFDFRSWLDNRVATVSLALSGRQVIVSTACLRRCPELRYVRPAAELAPGAA
jgi:hypothetical protein